MSESVGRIAPRRRRYSCATRVLHHLYRRDKDYLSFVRELDRAHVAYRRCAGSVVEVHGTDLFWESYRVPESWIRQRGVEVRCVVLNDKSSQLYFARAVTGAEREYASRVLSTHDARTYTVPRICNTVLQEHLCCLAPWLQVRSSVVFSFFSDSVLITATAHVSEDLQLVTTGIRLLSSILCQMRNGVCEPGYRKSASDELRHLVCDTRDLCQMETKHAADAWADAIELDSFGKYPVVQDIEWGPVRFSYAHRHPKHSKHTQSSSSAASASATASASSSSSSSCSSSFTQHCSTQSSSKRPRRVYYS